MAGEIVDLTNLMQGTGLVGGIVALATTAGWWLRKERVEASKANNSVAANNASTNSYESLHKDNTEMRIRLVQLEITLNSLMKRIVELESRLIGLDAHHDNLILCDMCVQKNERILHAINKTLKIKDPAIQLQEDKSEP